MEKCINFIEENAVECVKSNAFLTIKRDTLIKVISSDDFAMDEADVFRLKLFKVFINFCIFYLNFSLEAF